MASENGRSKRGGGFAGNPELARAAGRRGGETVRKRYGTDFFQEIGKKGGDTVRRERGSEFFAEIGRKGGQNKARKHSKP